ncbi:hypothetical protein FB451DRAFT_1274484 [Mycena latifolia]|nr:hypothetical protein FB451DRAFT_1274484 [Mycena latifolia]
MAPLPFALVLVAMSLLSPTAAQTGTPHIDGAQNSKVAITGAIIGGVLIVLSLIAVAVYCIERCLHRRRNSTRFTPLPTLDQSEAEPYQYLSLPRPAMGGRSGHGPFYPGSVASPPASPNSHMSYGSGSPLRSPGAQSLRFEPYGSGSPLRSPGGQSVRSDLYGHGPFYPGTMAASPPASPNTPASFRTSLIVEPFRRNSQRTLDSLPSNLSATPSSSSLRDGNESRTLSRATSTTLVS